MKSLYKKPALFLILLSFCACVAQEKYISNQYEKGYVKKGRKVSFWEFYDGNGTLDLKMNYDNGQILYLKPDTSEYVININGKWISQKLKVYPKYIGSVFTFYKDAGNLDFLSYPDKAFRNFTEGYVYISFIVDSTGAPGNFKIEKDIGDGCGQVALKSVEKAALRPGKWIPAQLNGKTYSSRFIIPIRFRLNPTKKEHVAPEDPSSLPPAKFLEGLTLTAYQKMP